MIEEIAAKLYLISKDTVLDEVHRTLQVLDIMHGQEVDKVLSTYKMILSGEIKVVLVEHARKIEKSTRVLLEKTIINEHLGKSSKNCIFLYEQMPDLIAGFRIRIDDNILDLSILEKIENIRI